MPVDAARLQRIEIFADLGDEQLDEVATAAKEAAFSDGENVVRHGEWPYDLFALEEGSVEVRRDGELVATLQAGDVVGETGVLRRALRNADVTAVGDVRVLYFPMSRVKELRRSIPGLDGHLERLAGERAP